MLEVVCGGYEAVLSSAVHVYCHGNLPLPPAHTEHQSPVQSGVSAGDHGPGLAVILSSQQGLLTVIFYHGNILVFYCHVKKNHNSMGQSSNNSFQIFID